MRNQALISSNRQDWETPPELIAEIQEVSHLELDPCTTAANPTGASHFFATGSVDGLTESWHDTDEGGLVFVNPPYDDMASWVDKCLVEHGFETQILLLAPARPGSVWFKKAALAANEVCFLDGRLRFVGAPAPAPFPSILFCFGQRIASRFVEVFDARGWIP